MFLCFWRQFFKLRCNPYFHYSPIAFWQLIHIYFIIVVKCVNLGSTSIPNDNRVNFNEIGAVLSIIYVHYFPVL